MIAIGNPANAEVMTRAVKGRSLWVDASRRLRRNRAAMTALVVLAAIALMALFGLVIKEQEVETLAKAYLNVKGVRDALRKALREARPYIFNRTQGADWRAETAADVLSRVDAALEGSDTEDAQASDSQKGET